MTLDGMALPRRRVLLSLPGVLMLGSLLLAGEIARRSERNINPVEAPSVAVAMEASQPGH